MDELLIMDTRSSHTPFFKRPADSQPKHKKHPCTGLLFGLLFVLATPCLSQPTPNGWERQANNGTVVFRPSTPTDPELLVKYYPPVGLNGRTVDDWLRQKLTNSQAPRGQWSGAVNVTRDNDYLAHGLRSYIRANGQTGTLLTTALTLDHQTLHMAVMLLSSSASDTLQLEQAKQLMVDFVKTVQDDSQGDATQTNSVTPTPPSERKTAEMLTQADAKRYKYTTQPGKGLPSDQTHAILYIFDMDYYAIGGAQMDESIYLLTRDGRVMKDPPVAPEILDVTKSQRQEPKRWGWWRKDGEDYRFAWADNPNRFEAPRGDQIVTTPIPAGTRLEGTWSGASSYYSLGYSSSSFWGVTLDKHGRFHKYRNSMRQGGGESGGGGPLITSASNDEGTAISVIGSQVGGGGSTKKRSTASDREGRYEFDGYNLTLSYDNGEIKHFPTFRIGDDYSSIWFEGGDLSRK
jgi:hypothetical protein